MIRSVQRVADLRQAVAKAREGGVSVGLVPTMGALHRGHAALIARSAAGNDFTVVSIFVNPTQFGPGEDLARYPRPLEEDMRLAEEAGADLVFNPPVEEVYPEGFDTMVKVGGGLAEGLCGASRPGHFEGVATVVLKLFNMVAPDRACFGEKDYQQLQIICRLVRDLDLPLEIVPVPTVREEDGLALSSRNRYLSPQERRQAPLLYQALCRASEAAAGGEKRAAVLIAEALKSLQGSDFRVEYMEIVDGRDLQPLEELRPGARMMAAARLGTTRLIDNIGLGYV